MEGFNRNLKTKGVTLDTDSSETTRISQRPSQPKGYAYEDLGSDFAGRGSSRTSQTSRNLHNPSKRGSSSKHDGGILDVSSDDELDFLSSSSRHGSQSPTKPKKHRKRKVSEPQPADLPLPIAIDYHQTRSDYKPANLKKMKIAKKSSAATTSSGTPHASQGLHSGPGAGPGPSSSASSDRTSAIVAALFELKREQDQAARKGKGSQPLRERSPNQDRASPRKSYLPDWDNSDEEDKTTEKTPRPARSVPRPSHNGTTSKLSKSQTIADMGSSASQDKGKNKQKEKARSVSRSKTMQHISESPLDISDDDLTASKCTEFRSKAHPSRKPTNPIPKPKPRPKENIRVDFKAADKRPQREYDPIGAIFGETDSPPPRPSVETARAKSISEFPVPSPLSSPAASRTSSPPRKSQPRSHRVVLSEDDDGSETGRAIRPFPMDTHLLEDLKRVSPAKRAATGSDAEGSGTTHHKRAKRLSHDNLESSFGPDNSDSDPDLDDIFLDPSVDPKTLCPWCDERLPSNPTPHLISLMEGARRRSYADDRPTNPLGLRAPPTVFVGVCQRHRFERIWIPRARKRGWPTRIDWGRLSERIRRLKATLQALVDDIDEDFSPGASWTDVKGKGKEERPRKTNEFWQELVKNVREQGSRQTTGVRGQFLHFNKTQPGYYGELGYVIIHQTLCDLFPPVSFDPAAAQPLTPADFISHVLVPEAAANLIMEDLGLSRADALKTLRESVEYGVAMFPADEGEGGKGDGDTSVLTAGERMLMERARARRKELEEEERMEAEEERRAQARAGRTDTDMDMDEDMGGDRAPSSSSQGKKPKPRPVAKRKPPSSEKPKPSSAEARRSRSRSKTLESDAGTIDLSSDAGNSTDASRSKRRRKAPEGPPSSRSDVPTDSGAATPRPKPKPKPRPRAVVRTASQSGRQSAAPSSDPQLPDEDEEPQPPPQVIQFATLNLKEAGDTHNARMENPLDATPRPKPKAIKRTVTNGPIPADASGSKPGLSGGAPAGSRLPLQLARERRQERGNSAKPASGATVKSKHSDVWLPSLRGGVEDEFSSTDEDEPDRPAPLSKTAAPRRTASRSSNGKNGEKWSWLLSDGSSAGSRTSSFAS